MCVIIAYTRIHVCMYLFQILVLFSPLGRVNLLTTCQISSGLEMTEFYKLPVVMNTQL